MCDTHTYGCHLFGSFTFEKKCLVHIIYVGGIVCGCVCLYFLKHMRVFLLVCVCVFLSPCDADRLKLALDSHMHRAGFQQTPITMQQSQRGCRADCVEPSWSAPSLRHTHTLSLPQTWQTTAMRRIARTDLTHTHRRLHTLLCGHLHHQTHSHTF